MQTCYLLFHSQTEPNIGRLLNFIIINTAWRDFEIKFMIFNLNSFKVLGPLAIMAHTWTLGGDLSALSTGNWNENLNCKLWFWIWNFHETHKGYFSFHCMLMNYGKNWVFWVSNIEVRPHGGLTFCPQIPVQKYINQSIMEATSHYISTFDCITSIWVPGLQIQGWFHLTKWHSLSSHLDMVKQDLLTCLKAMVN